MTTGRRSTDRPAIGRPCDLPSCIRTVWYAYTAVSNADVPLMLMPGLQAPPPPPFAQAPTIRGLMHPADLFAPYVSVTIYLIQSSGVCSIFPHGARTSPGIMKRKAHGRKAVPGIVRRLPGAEVQDSSRSVDPTRTSENTSESLYPRPASPPDALYINILH